ncbi:unnamed protein product [Peniophora sp. CBMAI 1063]|nr:unnamed protein product [Peniophora sp. CBMAI 1063]
MRIVQNQRHIAQGFSDVSRRSAQTAFKVSVPEAYDPSEAGPGGWDALARKWNIRRAAYVAALGWREKKTRVFATSSSICLFQPESAFCSAARAGGPLEVVRKAVKHALVESGAAGKSAVAANEQDVAERMGIDTPVPVPASNFLSPPAPVLVTVSTTSLWTTPATVSSAVASYSIILVAFPSAAASLLTPPPPTPAPFAASTSPLLLVYGLIYRARLVPTASTPKSAERLARPGGMRAQAAAHQSSSAKTADHRRCRTRRRHSRTRLRSPSQRNANANPNLVPLQATLAQVGKAGTKRKRKRATQAYANRRRDSEAGNKEVEEVEGGW